MYSFGLPISLRVMGRAKQRTSAQTLHECPPKCTRESGIAIMQNIVRHAELAHNLLEKQRSSFLRCEGALPHLARTHTHKLGQTVDASIDGIIAITQGQIRDKVHAP